jgi:metallophosphoesterase superfamily enzyme
MRVKCLFILCLVLTGHIRLAAQQLDYSLLEDKFNFYVTSDLGRNGYYSQQPIAELMGETAGKIGPEFIIAAGDVHHYEGVRSVNDPLWMTNYELIYKHPELMVEWYAILGNHEYRGSTQAVLDYGNVSRRWSMPDRYYSKVFDEEGVTVRIVWIDTTPLIDKYRNDNVKYPDACKQDMQKQLAWIDSVLSTRREDWIIVVGHHPIYAQTSKADNERGDLQKRLDPILRRHNIDMYVCGHIHNFQYIRVPGSNIDYVVNTSASLSRAAKPMEGTQFCNGEAGFSVCSVDKSELKLYMINEKGNVVYTLTRHK